jgi:hypothetical protein
VTDVDTDLSSADESEGELAQNKEKERMESLQKLQGDGEGTCYFYTLKRNKPECLIQMGELADGCDQKQRQSLQGKGRGDPNPSQML